MKELFCTKLTCNIIYALVLVLSCFDTVYNYWYVRHVILICIIFSVLFVSQPPQTITLQYTIYYEYW